MCSGSLPRKKKVERVVFKAYQDFLFQEVLSDGVEKFLRWDGMEAIYVEEFGEEPIFKPEKVLKNGNPVVIMPSKREDYGTVQDLLTRIEDFLRKNVELDSETYWLLSRFVLHTWVYDVGVYAMQLLVVEEEEGDAFDLLKLLASVCYNSVLISILSSPAALRWIRERYRGTILVDGFEPELLRLKHHRENIRFLSAGFERSNRLISGNRYVFDPFGPNVLSSISLGKKPSPLPKALCIQMGNLKCFSFHENFKESESLRNQLLAFRLDYWKKDFKLPDSIHQRLRENQVMGSTLKQICFPLLSLAHVTGLSIDEIISSFEKIAKEREEFMIKKTRWQKLR